jgi:hypothetical protein
MRICAGPFTALCGMRIQGQKYRAYQPTIATIIRTGLALLVFVPDGFKLQYSPPFSQSC